MNKEKVKLIMDEETFKNIQTIINKEGYILSGDKIRLQENWREILVENIRREKSE